MSKGAPPEAPCPVQPGDVVAGKYRVERVLGAGGMGVVVAALQLDLDRRVALKFLLPKVLERGDVLVRFSREARAAAKLESEHVARVLDVGALGNDMPYIVMEFLEGQDLSRLLAARGPLPPAEAVGYVLEAAEAVAEAHSHGIVHRDLKPANLFLAKRARGTPIIKVLDFGLSKFSGLAGEDSVTSASGMLGSPAYMSPEQLMSSRAVDARSDIWSLGVALYELLTNRTPFARERMPELVAAILHAKAVPLTQSWPGLPPGLALAIERCLEKEPARRFANLAELARALSPHADASGQRSIETIERLLEAPAIETLDAQNEAPFAQTEPIGGLVQGPALAGGGSLPGASQTIRLPERVPETPVAPAASGTSGDRKAFSRGTLAVASIAAVAGIVAFFTLSRPAPRDDTALVAPSGSSGTTSAQSVVSPERLVPGAVQNADAHVAAAPAIAIESVSASTPVAPAVPPSKPVRKKRTGGASVEPAPAGVASAKPAPEPAGSSQLDPLTRLKHL